MKKTGKTVTPLTTHFHVYDIPLPIHAKSEPANVSYMMYSFQETFAFQISPLCKYYLCQYPIGRLTVPHVGVIQRHETDTPTAGTRI